jgi:hypothetical protein
MTDQRMSCCAAGIGNGFVSGRQEVGLYLICFFW